MIVELFGPPGAGKTTFARALTTRLRERGVAVELVLSYRPAENSSTINSAPSATHAAAMRLARPAIEMLAAAPHLFADWPELAASKRLMRALPPKHIIWSIRLRQYLLRLSRSWHVAAMANHIVIFDQAFMQAVCSLALMRHTCDPHLIAIALDGVPEADLLIRIDAPSDVLEARLIERQRLQSRMERLLELDLKTLLKSAQVIDRVNDVLEKRGKPVIRASSTDFRSLRAAVETVARETAGMCGADLLVGSEDTKR
jgi:thymidylate kinase